MSRLLKKRQAIRTQVTRVINEANVMLSATEEITADALNVLLERLQLFRKQLTDVDDQIETEGLEQEEGDYVRICEYNDQMVTCITKLKCKATQSAQPAPQPVQKERSATTRVKLPKLELRKFDGRPRNWQAFWEQFDNLIHKNGELSQNDKFSYLKTALTGDAAAAIAGLHLSAVCYNDAVELLQQRFGKDTTIIQDHMESLLNVRPVRSSDDVRELRRLHDRIQAHLRGLKALGVNEDSYCSLLYPVLLRSLPKDLVLRYNRKAAQEGTKDNTPASATNQSGDRPQAAELPESSEKRYHKEVSTLLEMLRVEVESRERVASVQKTDGRTQFKSVTTEKTARPFRATASALQQVASQPECIFCSSKEHGCESCDAGISLAAKKEILGKGRRCYRCTRPNHQSRICRSKVRCKRCGGRMHIRCVTQVT